MDEGSPSDQRHTGVYAGYNIIYHRGQLHAFASSLGSIVIQEMDASSLEMFERQGLCIVASTFNELKEQITSHLLVQALTQIQTLDKDGQTQTLESELQSVRETNSQLATSLAEVIASLHKPSRARQLVRALLDKAG
jgi:hypothetical protein